MSINSDSPHDCHKTNGTYYTMNFVTLARNAASVPPDEERLQLAFIVRGPTIWAITPVGLGSPIS
jgi:hypothetical protein